MSVRRSAVAPTISSLFVALVLSACSSADDAAKSAADELNALSSIAQTAQSSASAALNSAFTSASAAVQSRVDASATQPATRVTATSGGIELTDDTINWFQSFCGTVSGALVARQAADALAKGNEAATFEERQDAGAGAYSQLGEQLGEAAANIGTLPQPDLPGASTAIPGVLDAMSDLSATYIDTAAALTAIAAVEEEPYQAAVTEANAPAQAAEMELAKKTRALRASIGPAAAAAVDNLDNCAFLAG